MLLQGEGPNVGQLNDRTLRGALYAQLVLLDGHFPLAGWVIAREQDDRFTVLTTHGSWRSDADLGSVGHFMGGSWAAPSAAIDFAYRTLSAVEQVTMGKLASGHPVPDSVLRHPLCDPEGQVLGWLIGVAACDTFSAITQPGLPIDYVRQTLLTMASCLTLHARCEDVQRQLTELQQNAFTEPLTGVLNRAGWVNRVQHLEAIVARTQEDVAIIMLDLDLLKLVNDRQGHSAGDELLQLTAQTIESVLRTSDVVGRLGGDEFGVAIRGVSVDLANILVGRLRAALSHVGVNVSMGLALKSEAGSLDDTLACADQRMYEEKRAKPMPAEAMNWQRGTVVQSLDSRELDSRA